MKQLSLLLLLFPALAQAQYESIRNDFGSPGKSVQVTARSLQNDLYEISLTEIGAKDGKTFKIQPLNFSQFMAGFRSAVGTAAIQNLEATGKELFIDIVAYFLTAPTQEVLAGEIFIHDRVRSHIIVESANEIREREDVRFFDSELTVKNVQFEFEEGFILNVVVETEDHLGRTHLFANPYSIGFASMYNLSVLNRYYLKQINRQDKLTVIIKLADVVRFYRPHLRPLTRDYSPRDGSFTFVPQNERIKLRKEETQKLLEARVYSDFIGLNQEKPNGLIQTEISKRINTNTERGWLPMLLGRKPKHRSLTDTINSRVQTLRNQLEKRANKLEIALAKTSESTPGTKNTSATTDTSDRETLKEASLLEKNMNKLLLAFDDFPNVCFRKRSRDSAEAFLNRLRAVTPKELNVTSVTKMRDRLRQMGRSESAKLDEFFNDLKPALHNWKPLDLREKNPGSFWRTIVDPLTFILGDGAGVFQYVTPVVTLSKLEENNKYLPVSRLDGGKGKSYLTALDVLQYQNFSAGLDANLLYFDNMSGKYNLTLDGRLRFGRTALTDSVAGQSRRDFGVNTVQVGPEVKMQWFPDERFGFSITRRWDYTTVLSNEIDQQGVYQRDTPDLFFKPLRDGIWISTWELSAFLKPSENGKLFFRYRLIHQGPNHQGALFGGNRQANFQQAQVGYSFYLLRNRKGSEDRGGR